MEPLQPKEGDFGYIPGEIENKPDIFHQPDIKDLPKTTKKGNVSKSLKKITKEPALFPDKLKRIADIVAKRKGNLTGVAAAIVACKGIKADISPKKSIGIVRTMLLRLYRG